MRPIGIGNKRDLYVFSKRYRRVCTKILPYNRLVNFITCRNTPLPLRLFNQIGLIKVSRPYDFSVFFAYNYLLFILIKPARQMRR